MINLKYVKGENLNILDFGCGFGVNTIPLLKLGHNVTGMDLNPECEQHILNKIEKGASSRFNFKVTQEKEIPVFGHVKYDLIICTETLEHIENYKNIIRYFGEIIKKEGLLVISIPTYLSEKLFLLLDSNWLADSGHINVFREKDFINNFLDNDFKLLSKERRGSDWFLTWIIFKLFLIRHNMGVPAPTNNVQLIIVKATNKIVNVFRVIKPANKLLDFIIPKSIVFYFNK